MHRMTLITPPATLPVPVDMVKQHLNVLHADDDLLIERYIRAATGQLDGWTGILGRALVAQEWELTLDCFPADCIRLPLGPAVSVTSVKYLDSDGALQTVSSADYEVDFTGPLARLRAPDGWPATGDYLSAAQIRWVAGTGCPEAVQIAIMMIARAMYDNRSGAVEDSPAVQSLIAPFRHWVV